MRQRITLEAPHIGPVAASMLNVSLGGALVETDPMVLGHNASVVVAFDLPESGQNDAFRLDAVVVRRTPTGAGLMFRHMHTGVIRALSGALSKWSALEASRGRPPRQGV